MISWIQNTFQKHFRVIFLVLLALLIVSFVFTIGAAPGIGRADGRVSSRTYFDLNLASPEDTERIFGDASLSVFLQAGYSALDESQLQDYALQRHAGLHLANELNLPAPSRDELAPFIREMRAFAGENGQFDPQAYGRFRDSLKSNPRFGEADLARVLGDDYRYDQVQKLLGGPGYVLDSDVKQQLVRADTSWTINVATVDYTSFSPEIEPSEADIRAYFDNNIFRYEVPPHVRVSYVEFPAAAYAGRVNLTEAEVRAYYDANPARFPNPEAAEAATPTVDAELPSGADFAAVRPQVEAALRQERARRLAAQAASDLTVALFDAGVTAENVEQVLTSQGRTLQAAEPFARNSSPAFLGENAQNAAAAFELGPQRPVSDALLTPTGAVVLVWQETLPAHPPEFAAVQDQVRNDYLEDQRRQRFAALGRTLRERIANRISNGEEFEASASAEAEAGNVQIEIKSFGPFTRRDPPQDAPFPAINALEGLDQGELSEMIVTGDAGHIVHAAEKSRPDVSPDHERFTEVRTQVAQFNAGRNADEILRLLVRAELESTETATR